MIWTGIPMAVGGVVSAGGAAAADLDGGYIAAGVLMGVLGIVFAVGGAAVRRSGLDTLNELSRELERAMPTAGRAFKLPPTPLPLKPTKSATTSQPVSPKPHRKPLNSP